MAIIQRIRKKVDEQDFEFTLPHFFEEMVNDNLAFADVQMAIAKGQINRKFTRDPRGTRFEVIGPARDGRMIGIICRFKSTGKLLFITTYAVEGEK